MAKILRVGHTLDPETMIGPLVSEVQLDRVTGYIDSGRQEGATVMLEAGARTALAGSSSPPCWSILKPAWRSAGRRSGAVLCATRSGEHDADRLASLATRPNTASPRRSGPATSAWPTSCSPPQVRHDLRQRRRGVDPASPLGGYKASGRGRENGKAGIEAYTELKRFCFARLGPGAPVAERLRRDRRARGGARPAAARTRARDGRPDPAWLDSARRWSAAVWDRAAASGPAALTPETVERGLALAARPVFVCGAHRSGTSLVRNLLDGHPALAVLPSEGTFYTGLERRLAGRFVARAGGGDWGRNGSGGWPIRATSRRSGCSAGAARRHRLTSTSPASSAPGGRCWPPGPAAGRSLWPLVAVALAWAGRARRRRIPEGVGRWVEKTPTNERYLAPDRGPNFPQARVDPRGPPAGRGAGLAQGADGRAVGAPAARSRPIYRNMARSLRIALEQSRARAFRPLPAGALRGLGRRSPPRGGRRLAEFLGIEPLPGLLRADRRHYPGAGATARLPREASGAGTALTRLERAILAATSGSAAARGALRDTGEARGTVAVTRRA